MRTATSIIRIVPSREPSDCAIVALAHYLGQSYEDVLRVTSDVHPTRGKNGLFKTHMIEIAARLGFALRVKRRFDYHDDNGILVTPTHAAVLFHGVVLDTQFGDLQGFQNTLWDVEAWVTHRQEEHRIWRRKRETREPWALTLVTQG